MGIFDNCLLACDVDGTLICEEKLPENNIKSIEFFIKQGGKFALSTGRSPDALKQLFLHMDRKLAGMSVVLGGGMIYDFQNEKIVSRQILSDSDKFFSEYVRDNFKDVGIEVHLDGVVNVLNATYESDIHEQYEDLNCEFKPFDSIKQACWNKVLYTVKTEQEAEKLLEILSEKGSKTCLFMKTSADIYGEKRFYVEQLPYGISKGKAVKEMAKILGIKNGGVFGIGDYYNDIEMLKCVDIGAATMEAPCELKKEAKYITCEAKNGAVADFINYLTELFGEEENNGY